MALGSLVKAWTHLQFEGLKDGLNKKSFQSNAGQAHDVAEQIKNNGLYIIPDYYSPSECDELIGEIDRLISGNEAHVWQDDTKSDVRLYGSHLYSNSIKEFYKDPFLTEIGERYLKTNLINSHTLGARLVPKDGNLGSGGGWHRDSVFKKQYKSIVYLTDVGLENGPFEFVVGSHDKSTIYSSIKKNKFDSHQNRISNEQVEGFLKTHPGLRKQICTAKKGTVVLVDTSGIHRGMPIEEGIRYALTNYFYPVHHYTESQKEKFGKLF